MKHSPKQKKQPDLTILIPAYREEKRIGKTLDTLSDFLKRDTFMKKLDVEVVVVSANSPDKTHTIVEGKKKLFKDLTLLKPGRKVGKGRDVQYGMLRSNGAKVIFMDADLATPLHHVPDFYKICDKGADVVAGTRNLRTHHDNMIRRILSNVGNLLFRVVGGVWIEDSQCGFKMFTHEAAQLCFGKLTIKKWGFDMEVLAIAQTNKLRIETRRINDWQDMPDSTFTGSIVQNALNSLKDLGHVAKNRLRGVYRKN